jgi:hypothetical protein
MPDAAGSHDVFIHVLYMRLRSDSTKTPGTDHVIVTHDKE